MSTALSASARCGCAHRADEHDETGPCGVGACGCTRLHDPAETPRERADLAARGDALATAAAFVLAHTHTLITEDLRQGLDRAVREWREGRR